MKKSLTLLVILLSLITLLSVSCKAEAESASLRIEMKNSRRTVKPDAEEMEIYGYKVITISPDGKESDPYYTYYSYINLDGLTVGKWKIKVYGFNSARKDLAYGEGEISLIAGKNTIAISLDELVGNGDLKLTLKWDENVIKDIKSIHTVFKSQSGNEIILTPSTPSEGECTIYHTNLPSGSYTLQAELIDSTGNKVLGLATAIRITNETVTEETLEFVSSTEETAESEITISDKTSTPVEVSITGLESLIEADKVFTVAISVPGDSTIKEKDLNTIWYLDGVEAGRGNSCTFKNGVGEGSHRIDVVTSTGEAGSLGSQSFSFRAAASTKEGDLYQKITLSSSSTGELVLGGDTVMHFLPNNYLLIANNKSNLVQLVKMTSSSYAVAASYSYNEVGIGEYDVSDFATTGSSNESYYSVIVLCNSTSSCKAVNLMVSTTQITFNDEETSFDSSGGVNRACRFVRIVEGDNVFIAQIENVGKTRMGYVAFNFRPNSGNMINRDGRYITAPTLEFGYSGFKDMATLPSTGRFISISGQRGKVGEAHYNDTYDKAGFSEYFMWVSWSDYVEYYNANKTKDEFRDGISCGFLENTGNFAFILSSEKIIYYKKAASSANGYEQYREDALEEGIIPALEMCRDTKYGYMIDNEEKKLVTVTPTLTTDGVYVLEKGSSIALDGSTYNSIEISNDGKWLAVFNSTDCSQILIVKASR